MVRKSQFNRKADSDLKKQHYLLSIIQECIPVGCVPSAAVTVSRGGGCLLQGGCLLGGCLVPGGLLLGGVSAPGGVWSQGGVCSRVCVCSRGGGGVCSRVCVCSWGCVWSQGGFCSEGCLVLGVWSQGVSALGGGVSGPRGCLVPGGVSSGGCLLPGGYPSMHWGRHPPCGQTDACKNITFATLLRTVIISFYYFAHHFPLCNFSQVDLEKFLTCQNSLLCLQSTGESNFELCTCQSVCRLYIINMKHHTSQSTKTVLQEKHWKLRFRWQPHRFFFVFCKSIDGFASLVRWILRFFDNITITGQTNEIPLPTIISKTSYLLSQYSKKLPRRVAVN